MTVSTEINHNEYTGNGETTHFPYTFRIFKNADLVVSVVDLNGNLSVLALDTDYTVAGAGGYANGNVVLKSPLESGWQISISRELPVTQETDLRNQGKFFPEIHEDALDKLTMLIQQFWNRFSLDLKKPSFVANYYDALGNAIRHLLDPTRPQDAATKRYVDTLDKKTNQHIDALNSATNARVTKLDKATNERVVQLYADISNRALRAPEAKIPPIPDAATRAGKLLSFDALGAPMASLPPAGSAADVLTELAKTDGATKIGRQRSDGKSETVQQALTNIRDETDKKFDKTGGTVNGPLTVEGNAKFTGPDYLDKSGVITDKNSNVRETHGLRIRGAEGQRADLRYWEKIGQGASLKLNVIAGNDNGEFTFSQRGNFSASKGAIFGGNVTVSWGGRTAIYHENGDIDGPIWSGNLSGYLNKTFSRKIHDYGEIGSYIVAWCDLGDIGPNTQVAGDNLYASNCDGTHIGDYLPGMWRCMGKTDTRNDKHRTTLWVRIS